MNQSIFMRILKKHLNNIIWISAFFLLLNCEQNSYNTEKNGKTIVSIGKKKLTSSQVDSISLVEKNKLKTKSELIKSWTDREVLYNAAVDDSILYLQEYKEIINQSKKELAVAYYLREVLKKYDENISYSMISNFYEDHSEEFRCAYTSYFLKQADFKVYKTALDFRKEIFLTDWEKASDKFKNESDVNFTEKLIVEHDINPAKLQRLIKNLLNDEVSIILETEPNKYSVVQLVRKFYKNQIPELKFVINKVKQRLVMIEKKMFINDLINDLYIKYKVESFKDSI